MKDRRTAAGDGKDGPITMQLALIDGIGPFFKGFGPRRINWSKIPFPHLATDGPEADAQWDEIGREMRVVATRARELGYTALTLDDVAHVTPDDGHDARLQERIARLRARMVPIVDLVRECGLRVYFTADFVTTSEGVDKRMGEDPVHVAQWFAGLCARFLDDFRQVDGVILRIGESDGLDVQDALRSRLVVRTAREVNRVLRILLPVFEERSRRLIFRTWTVGAYLVGDLIWHRGRLARALEGLESPALVVSMKHGESDFFRYLPLNRQFFRVTQPKIIEFQARREYEGAGEFPAFIGWEVEQTVRELDGARDVIGFSVWCQTGGWHAFRRRAFLEEGALWIDLNAAVVPGLLRREAGVEALVIKHFPTAHPAEAVELLRRADIVVRQLMYIEEFARQKLFFRRVRIPPLLHVYWDNIFIVSALHTVLSHFVSDGEESVRQGEAAFGHFAEMEVLAAKVGRGGEDVRFMRDTFEMILWARRYFFLPRDPGLEASIREAKARYKERWPRESRPRYRVRIAFAEPFLNRRVVAWLMRLLTRRQRGYRRVLDHVFTLKTLSWMYRLFHVRHRKALPKFLRKTAMGVDTLFR